jgi:hypothetical protein
MKKLLSYHGLSMLFLIEVASVLYIVWRLNSPYPHALNWDIWEHQTAINAIRDGHISLMPSALSDTFQFDGYTTIFHMILAGIQEVFQIKDVLGFWWIAENIFFALTTLVAYMFSYAVTRNRLAAVIAGVLSACLFESAMAYTTLFLLPQTVTALLWVVGMTAVTYAASTKKRTLIALLFSLLMIPLHAIVGTFAAVILMLYAVGLHILPKHNTIYAIGVGISTLLAYIIPTYVAQHAGLGSINAGEAASFTQTFDQKLSMMRQWYGVLPLPLLVFGLWQAMTSGDGMKKLLVALFAISAGFIAATFPYVLKFVVIERYMMIAIMAMGVAWYMRQMRSTMEVLMVICVTVCSAVLIFYTNVTHWKDSVVFRGVASHISADERVAASALRFQYGVNKDAFLISDPATQYVLETLSGVNSQGGAYMTVKTRTALLTALQSETASDFTKELSRIQDTVQPGKKSPLLLAVSGRTFAWLSSSAEQKMDIAYNVWRPNALSLQASITMAMWKERFGLKEVYRNNSVVVFEIPSI